MRPVPGEVPISLVIHRYEVSQKDLCCPVDYAPECGGNAMRSLNLWLMTAGLAVSVCTGCSQNAMTVRGQSPEPQGVPGLMPQSQMYAGPAQELPPGAMPANIPYDPTMQANAATWGGNGWGMNGSNPPMPGYDPAGGTYGYERSYRFKYKEPRDLRYPPVGDKLGVVQYPYYTFKGPDDFFLK